MSESETVNFCCYLCSQIFSTRNSLSRHRKVIHMIDDKNVITSNFEQYNNKCLEEDCRTSYRLTSGLRYHLETCHDWKIETEERQFSTKEEFESWFIDICVDNNLSYFRREQRSNKIIYFTCNRSGKVIVKSKNRQRKLKSQGSCKLGINCVSQIILKQNSDNTYAMTYYKNHYGHSTELQHLPLPNQKRLEVASQLAKGLTEEEVLNMFKIRKIDEKMARSDLITKKDISNIKAAFFKGNNEVKRQNIGTESPEAQEEEIEEYNYNTEDGAEKIRNQTIELQLNLEFSKYVNLAESNEVEGESESELFQEPPTKKLRTGSLFHSHKINESNEVVGESESELSQEEPPNKILRTGSLFYSHNESNEVEGESESELSQEEPPNKKLRTGSLFYSHKINESNEVEGESESELFQEEPPNRKLRTESLLFSHKINSTILEPSAIETSNTLNIISEHNYCEFTSNI